jgi:hypothetical protein
MGFGNNYTTNLTEGIFVEKLPTENNNTTTKGLALSETSGWFSCSATYPYDAVPGSFRLYTFGFGRTDGNSLNSSATFRPVIWNHSK